jgi:hypothetical protein
MAKGKSNGQMALSMKVNIRMGKRTVLVHLAGPTNHRIVVISLTIIFMVRAHTLGLMVEFLMAYGKTIRCMGKEYLLGPTAVNMKVITMMTRKKDMECSIGLMAVNMMATGKVANKKEWAFTTMPKAKSDMADGRQESVHSG